MEELKWTAVSGVGAILLIVALSAFLASSHGGTTGAFPTGPTLADTRGACIPTFETGCALPGAPDCCQPSRCVQRVGQAYLAYGVCQNKISTA